MDTVAEGKHLFQLRWIMILRTSLDRKKLGRNRHLAKMQCEWWNNYHWCTNDKSGWCTSPDIKMSIKRWIRPEAELYQNRKIMKIVAGGKIINKSVVHFFRILLWTPDYDVYTCNSWTNYFPSAVGGLTLSREVVGIWNDSYCQSGGTSIENISWPVLMTFSEGSTWVSLLFSKVSLKTNPGIAHTANAHTTPSQVGFENIETLSFAIYFYVGTDFSHPTHLSFLCLCEGSDYITSAR